MIDSTVCFFLGAPDHKIPKAAVDLLLNKHFEFCGKLMAHVGRHDCVVFPGVSDIFKSVLRGMPIEKIAASLEDIFDFELQNLLKKVTSLSSFRLFILKTRHFLRSCRMRP